MPCCVNCARYIVSTTSLIGGTVRGQPLVFVTFAEGRNFKSDNWDNRPLSFVKQPLRPDFHSAHHKLVSEQWLEVSQMRNMSQH